MGRASARFMDVEDQDVIGGYDVVAESGLGGDRRRSRRRRCWPRSLSSATARILIVALGALIAIGVSIALGVAHNPPDPQAHRDRAAGCRRRPAGTGRPGGCERTGRRSAKRSTRCCPRARTLLNQVTAAGVEVNSAAAELSASSDELAATTTQQSAAVTQATATTEELARASTAIADTVDDVAAADGGDPGQPGAGRG